jgi:hypothetical protein
MYITRGQRFAILLYAFAGVPVLYTAYMNHWTGTVWEWTLLFDALAVGALFWFSRRMPNPFLKISLWVMSVGVVGRFFHSSLYNSWDALIWIGVTIAIAELWTTMERRYRLYVAVFAALTSSYAADIITKFDIATTIIALITTGMAIALMVRDPLQVLDVIPSRLVIVGLGLLWVTFLALGHLTPETLSIAMTTLFLAKVLVVVSIWLYSREVANADLNQPRRVICHHCRHETTTASVWCSICGEPRVTEGRSPSDPPASIHFL